jgi:hypothetical protein
MRIHPLVLVLLAVPASLTTFACGGNVSVTGGAGGTGGSAAGGSAGSTTSSTTTSPPADFASCDGPGQCVLATPGCCAKCGTTTVADFVAVNSAKAGDYQKSVCPSPQGCPDCAQIVDPNIFAYCSAGKCVVADVRTDPVSQCQTDSDCHLRNGSACCEDCGGPNASEVISVSYKAPQDLTSLVCAPDTGCPKCLPQYPPAYLPICANGHCSIAAAGGAP